MAVATPVPRLEGFDHTLPFLREGYDFISRRCDRLQSDRFLTRLMLRPVLCTRGAEAAEMIYEGGRFTRQGALPPTTLRLLQDKGSVQQLDGAAHLHRKTLFVDLLMNDRAEDEVVGLFREEWRRALSKWMRRPQIVLLDEVHLVMTRAICRWTGVPQEEISAEEMAAILALMVENSGRIDPSVLLALMRRRKLERHLEGLVRSIRNGQVQLPPEAPIVQLARFRDFKGDLLPEKTAAVEILNILRPTLAIGRFIVFAAMALQEQGDWRNKLLGADDAAYEFFAEEVRRLYPFFPLVGGIAVANFEWRGYPIETGDWVLLDLYGTVHDQRLFANPDNFDPNRRLTWRSQGYNFIPQGAGVTSRTHRCPGEQFTVALMREATRMLVEEMEYEVLPQDLSMPRNRMPTRPKSGMIFSNVRGRAA